MTELTPGADPTPLQSRVMQLDGGGRYIATGYRVAGDLVLTARHGIGTAETVRVRSADTEDWIVAEVFGSPKKRWTQCFSI
jgi:hypothetical protein